MTDKKIALEDRGASGEKLFSPSAARNRDAIRETFLKFLPANGRVLEIGAGTGEHAVHVAAAAPGLQWFPGDPDETSRASIAAHIADSGLSNLETPHDWDVSREGWWSSAHGPFDAIVSINMIHIAPFEAAAGLFAGAGEILAPGGKLMLYGPFSDHGVHNAPSNEAFDASLKGRDPRWGVRDLEHDLAPLAQENALEREATVEMPANNFTVVFVKK